MRRVYFGGPFGGPVNFSLAVFRFTPLIDEFMAGVLLAAPALGLAAAAALAKFLPDKASPNNPINLAFERAFGIKRTEAMSMNAELLKKEKEFMERMNAAHSPQRLDPSKQNAHSEAKARKHSKSMYTEQGNPPRTAKQNKQNMKKKAQRVPRNKNRKTNMKSVPVSGSAVPLINVPNVVKLHTAMTSTATFTGEELLSDVFAYTENYLYSALENVQPGAGAYTSTDAIHVSPYQLSYLGKLNSQLESRVSRIADLYEEYQLEVEYEYRPNCGFATVGALIGAFDLDSSDSEEKWFGSHAILQVLATHAKCAQIAVTKEYTWRHKTGWLWCRMRPGQTDIRKVIGAKFHLVVAKPSGSSVTVGQLFARYRVRFRKPTIGETDTAFEETAITTSPGSVAFAPLIDSTNDVEKTNLINPNISLVPVPTRVQAYMVAGDYNDSFAATTTGAMKIDAPQVPQGRFVDITGQATTTLADTVTAPTFWVAAWSGTDANVITTSSSTSLVSAVTFTQALASDSKSIETMFNVSVYLPPMHGTLYLNFAQSWTTARAASTTLGLWSLVGTYFPTDWPATIPSRLPKPVHLVPAYLTQMPRRTPHRGHMQSRMLRRRSSVPISTRQPLESDDEDYKDAYPPYETQT
jgi:hypothetical protein